jgi:hypothetical protein
MTLESEARISKQEMVCTVFFLFEVHLMDGFSFFQGRRSLREFILRIEFLVLVIF